MKLTLRQTATRIILGSASVLAIKEHIDAWNKTFDIQLYQDHPPLTGQPHLDAWLAGAAHHEATLVNQECPAWANEPTRFLTESYSVGGKSERLFALVETPLPWRLRLVFTGKSFLRAPAQKIDF